MGPGWVLTQAFPGILCITGVEVHNVLRNLGEEPLKRGFERVCGSPGTVDLAVG